MAKKKSYTAIKKACKAEESKSRKKAPKAKITGHKTKKIVIKEVKIDEKIIPLVRWMNSFESIDTLFCCEGGTKQELKGTEHNQPYVLFTCWSQLELSVFLRELQYMGTSTCEATYYEPYGLRYHLKFPDKEAMLQFCTRPEVKKFE